MSKKQYDVKSLMISGNTISILGVIGDDWWEESNTSNQFLREFKTLEDKHDEIVIEINSPGGSLYHGQPIYNAIRNSKAKTTTRIIGMAASMAGVIALAGDQVEAFDNAILMLHSPINFEYGNARDFRDMADVLDTFAETLITSVAKKIGKTVEETKSLYFDYEDHFLTAAQAKDAGLVDSIIDEVADLPDGVNDMKMSDIVAYYEKKYSGKPKAKNPLSNFFQNITNSTKMKIDNKIITALNLGDNSGVDDVVDAIRNIITARDTAQNALSDEQTAHQETTTKLADTENKLTEANTQIQDLESERDQLQEQINNATGILDTIDQRIKDAEDFAKKLEALTSFTDEEETKQFLNRDKNRKSGEVPQYVKDAENFLG